MLVNAGAAPDDKAADRRHKYNGRDRHVQRERAAERRNDLVSPNVDPTIVARVIDQCQNPYELKRKLGEQGIECRFRYRNDEIYAWSLRNEGAKEWTSGSKLTASNDFGWKKVQDQLNSKISDRQPMKVGRRHPTRMRGLSATKRPLQPTRRIDQIADAGTAEALELANQLMSAMSRKRPVQGAAAPLKPASTRKRPAVKKPNKTNQRQRERSQQ